MYPWRLNFVLANSADQDEMLQYAAFHLGLHCFPTYLHCFPTYMFTVSSI